MPPSTRYCTESLQQETELYQDVVLASWAIVAANVLLYLICFRHRLAGAPGLGSQFFFVTGSMKLVLGLLILLLFLPSCPENCDGASACGGEGPEIFYALGVSLVGLCWIQQGFAFQQRAQLLENGESEGAQDTVFQPVSTKEDAEYGQAGAEEEEEDAVEVVEQNRN